MDPVLLECHDGVATIRLNRPDKRNAADTALLTGLIDALDRVEDDPDVRVAVIAGAGPGFCSGADLTERVGRDEAWVRRRRRLGFAAYERIEAARVPVVATVHGAVVGSGGEIAMACDFVVADHSARFRFPEAHWGTVGATQRLQRVVGKRRAKELLFTNRVLDAAEAHAIGLVTRLVDDLDAARAEITAAIAGAPPLALRLTKQAIDLGGATDQRSGIDVERAAIDHVLSDGGWREGVERFVDGIGTTEARR